MTISLIQSNLPIIVILLILTTIIPFYFIFTLFYFLLFLLYTFPGYFVLALVCSWGRCEPGWADCRPCCSPGLGAVTHLAGLLPPLTSYAWGGVGTATVRLHHAPHNGRSALFGRHCVLGCGCHARERIGGWMVALGLVLVAGSFPPPSLPPVLCCAGVSAAASLL